MRLTLTLFSVLVVMSTSAQVTPGLKLGMNFANYRLGNDDKSYETRLGFNAGVVAQVPLYKKLFLQPELLYTQKGGRYPSGVPVKGKIILNYASLALQPGYKIIPQLQVTVGPEFGYNLKREYDTDSPLFSGEDKNFSDLDVSMNFGLAFFPASNVAFEARYQRGIREVYELTITDQFGNEIGKTDWGRNHVFQVNFMYFFTRGKK